jgi:hypothetical protein
MGVDVQNTLSEATKMRKPEGIDKYGTLVKSPDPYLTPDQNTRRGYEQTKTLIDRLAGKG